MSNASTSANPPSQFNRLLTIVIWAFFLLVPWPILEPDYWVLGLVCIHAFLFVWMFYYRKIQTSFFAEAIRAGAFAYGIALLLIALQVRGWTQYLFMNPYFLAPHWGELWVPIFCFLGFIFVVGTFRILIGISQGSSNVGLTLGLVLWSIIFGLMVYYPLQVQLLLLSTAKVWTPAEENPREPINFERLSWEQEKAVEEKAYQLFRWSCVERDGASEAWCVEFEALRQADGGAFAINRLMGKDPEFRRAVHLYWDQSYGLDREIGSEFAWKTLERLGAEPLDVASSKRIEYVVQTLTPHLNTKQLIDHLVTATPESWPKILASDDRLSFDWRALPENNHLLPFVQAAWLLDRKQNTTAPGEYNDFENQIGQMMFCREPPRPATELERALQRAFTQQTRGNESFATFFGSMLQDASEYKPPFCAGCDTDDYFRRRQLWSLGPDVKLGNTTLKQSEHSMLFLDSKGGREWRRNRRSRLLELASMSIAPVPKPKKKPNDGTNIALGAVASVLSQGTQKKPWPTPPHLDFLFLDRGTEQQPSVAFEFWPELNAEIDEIERMNDQYKLSLRWNYLAKIWPESSIEMFVDCYLKTPAKARQNCLLGTYLDSRGLPGPLPPKVQLEILETIKQRLKASKKAVAKGVLLQLRQQSTKNEFDTIDIAISQVECVEGAEMSAKVFTRYRSGKDPFQISEGVDGYIGAAYFLGVRDQRYSSRYSPGNQRWYDDRLSVFANHYRSKFRMLAARLIRARPIPKYMPVLKVLKRDSNEKVKGEAEATGASLDKLRKRSKL